MINSTSVYVTILLSMHILVRLFYLMFSNKRRLPNELFSGKYLFCFLLMVISSITSLILTLLYSNSFQYNGFFFLFTLLVGISLSLYTLLWSLFFINGYNIQYQFRSLSVPIPMTILESFSLLLTIFLTFNFYLICPALIYIFASIIWNIKGFMLTKPIK